ncbi:MAG: hypothetical protein CME26_06575 [Gemmatimonadetes bacterium]|nr:hypothetical protein [Gemmatimonadota bacterium]
MGIRILAAHLTCPACGSALSPTNPLKGTECEAWGTTEPSASESLFERLRNRFRTHTLGGRMTRKPSYEISTTL